MPTTTNNRGVFGFLGLLSHREAIVFKFLIKWSEYDQNDYSKMKQLYNAIKQVGVD